jgi:membrane protein DedA with SNARE-associated domain
VTRVLVGTFCLLLVGSGVVSYYTGELSYFKDTASIIGIPLGMIIQYYFGRRKE